MVNEIISKEGGQQSYGFSLATKFERRKSIRLFILYMTDLSRIKSKFPKLYISSLQFLHN